MSRILVVFYSRSGHTEQLALQLAGLCGADTERVRDNTDRGGWLGYLRCAFEAIVGHHPRIRSCKYRPQDYDLVIIGTPVWFWNMASPVRSYLHRYRRRLTRVALFCTCGGSGGGKVFDDIEGLLGRPALARLAMKESQVGKGHEPFAFVKELKRLGAIRSIDDPAAGHAATTAPAAGR